MPTAQTIINNSLTILGILEQGGTPSATDSTAALAELNSMTDAWEVDEGLIYATTTVSGALTTTVGAYTIGSGAAFNVTRPTRIYQAFVQVSGNRNDIEVVNGAKFYNHNDLAATAVTPDQLYPDFNVNATTGFFTLNLWPVPTFGSGSPQLILEVGQPFGAWTLGGNVNLPYGYQDAIQYALAWRLIPQYGGVVAPQVMQTVAEIGEKAELRIRTMNAKNRQLQAQDAALAPLMPQQGQPGIPR